TTTTTSSTTTTRPTTTTSSTTTLPSSTTTSSSTPTTTIPTNTSPAAQRFWKNHPSAWPAATPVRRSRTSTHREASASIRRPTTTTSSTTTLPSTTTTSSSTTTTTIPANTCPVGQGFWKNHPSAWPVGTLVLGSQTYTQGELLAVLQMRTAHDASLKLADQLI